MGLPDMVLADSIQNAEYYAATFSLRQSNITTINVGADEDVFYPLQLETKRSTKALNILFFGTFIPLQGAEYIVQAAKLLERENVSFKFIGTGQTLPQVKGLAEQLSTCNTEFVDWVEYNALPEEIARADICLGIFGVTEKSDRVVPNKVYQCIAMGKPVITADTAATRTVFGNRQNALLCVPGDGGAIAESIMEMIHDPRLRGEIGEGALKLFRKEFTKNRLGQEFKSYLEKMLVARGSKIRG